METGTGKRCGLCRTPGVELVDSHIFPQWMGRDIQDGGPLISIPTHAGASPKFVHRNGEYDQVVCDACERSFGAADDYVARLHRDQDKARVVSRGTTSAYIYSGWDQALIQRFVLTCLFRAHLSARAAYAGIDLGPHAERVRDALLKPLAGILPGYDVVLMRETHALTDAIVVPHRIRIDGNIVWRTSFVGFGAMVRMVHPTLPSPIANLRLGKYPDIWMLELKQVHGNLMQALAKAEALHGDRIDRMLAPRKQRR